MSDLSVTVSSTGLVGLENNSAASTQVDKSGTKEVQVTEKAEKIAEPRTVAEAKSADVELAVQDMNVFMQSMQRNLSFSIDEQLGQAIISVTDVETNEVIRQIPSEELVVLRKKMDDVVGILFDTKV